MTTAIARSTAMATPTPMPAVDISPLDSGVPDAVLDPVFVASGTTDGDGLDFELVVNEGALVVDVSCSSGADFGVKTSRSDDAKTTFRFHAAAMNGVVMLTLDKALMATTVGVEMVCWQPNRSWKCGA